MFLIVVPVMCSSTLIFERGSFLHFSILCVSFSRLKVILLKIVGCDIFATRYF